MISGINEIYGRLLAEKREEVYAEIRAAMSEIHQTADIDRYIAEIKKKLMAELEGHGVLHII